MFGYRPHQSTKAFIITGLLLTAQLLAACSGLGTSQPKLYTIGVLSNAVPLDATVRGFIAQMTELGYVEGKNITYIYHGTLGTEALVAAELKSFMDRKVDLLFTVGNTVTLAAIKATSDIPIVFAPVIRPVESGIVADLRQPGGNVTGVQSVNGSPKALEYLMKIVPGTKKVYVPYNPSDQVSVVAVQPLPDAAAQLGIEIVLAEVTTAAQTQEPIQALPKESVMLLVPSPALTPSLDDITAMAIQRNIPVVAYGAARNNSVLAFGLDYERQGRQAARLANQIFNGVKPADLPVETGEFLLNINLKIAKEMGLTIPDSIVRLANVVVR